MRDRLDLHETICNVIGITESDGDRHVYYQPPESIKMKYPAIVYSRDGIELVHANNGIYKKVPSYSVILIDKKLESEYVDKLLEIPYCSYGTEYASNNLNHFTFKIYNY